MLSELEKDFACCLLDNLLMHWGDSTPSTATTCGTVKLATIGRSCASQHDGDIQKVEHYSANCTPEAYDVATTDAFTEEDAMVIIIFDADITVLAVIGILIDFKLAVLAPDFSAEPTLHNFRLTALLWVLLIFITGLGGLEVLHLDITTTADILLIFTLTLLFL